MNDILMPIRIFISSPGDLFPERDIIKKGLSELNDSYIYRNRFKLMSYMYEHMAPALIGEEPQIVIDKYVLRPEDADIFVCMLWHRFGTPTQNLTNPDTHQPYKS